MSLATVEPGRSPVRAVRSSVASAAALAPAPAAAAAANIALLASELAANPVLHARTPARTTVNEGVGRVPGSVTDGDPRLPVMRYHRPEAATGHGLHLVEAIADRRGVDSEKEGKTVWFEFDLVDPGVASSA